MIHFFNDFVVVFPLFGTSEELEILKGCNAAIL